MKELTKNYVRDYQRIAIISDHVSHIASDYIYTSIVDTMGDVVNHKNRYNLSLNPETYILRTYDEFDTGNFSTSHGVPRKVIFDNMFKNINLNDVFVIRCSYYNRMNNTSLIHTLPRQVSYNSDLIIGTVGNKLSIVKDRYGSSGEISEYNNYDLRNLGKSFKLKKILDRINS